MAPLGGRTGTPVDRMPSTRPRRCHESLPVLVLEPAGVNVEVEWSDYTTRARCPKDGVELLTRFEKADREAEGITAAGGGEPEL